jgi:hypothetical protein
MNGRLLRNRATLAGTIAAAAAGAVTVGLVSGVAHVSSSAQPATGTTTSTSSPSSSTTGSSTTGSSTTGSSTTVDTAPQSSQAQGGSNGS